MTYKSKRTITSMIAGLALIIAYLVFALGSSAPEMVDLQGWAIAILVLIGIGVASQIVIQIIFHIAFSVVITVKETAMNNEAAERIIAAESDEDEMDKLINLRSAHVGSIIAGFGFIAALAAIAAEFPAVFALHILLGAFLVGSLAEGCTTVFLYERGVSNG